MHIVGDSMKAHIQEEKSPIKLGKGTLFAKKDGEYNKVCDTAEYNETHTDDEVIKVALSEENLIRPMNFQSAFDNPYVFVD